MNQGTTHDWVATAPMGAASVLAGELELLGASHIKERNADVRFRGTLALGYRACLWLRAASRVFLSLAELDASDSVSLHASAMRIDWREHLAPGATLACDCSGRNAAFTNSLFGAQRLKDAVCDQLKGVTGERPNVRPVRPSVLLHLHIEGRNGLLSIDFSGESLHLRGYRSDALRAPIKENLAAAILLRCGWPEIFSRQGCLVDPMCGSGTFLIEAAFICADRAPGLNRDYFGFLGWRGHDEETWRAAQNEARMRFERGARDARRCLVGFDADPRAVAATIVNAQAAGMSDWIHVEKKSIDCPSPAPSATGLVIANPPYGERLGDESALRATYAQLGMRLRDDYAGWQAGILTGNLPLAKSLGLLAQRSHRFNNGSIECRLLRFELAAPSAAAELGADSQPNDVSMASAPDRVEVDWSARPGAQMFANRLNKNYRRFSAWAKARGICAYRVYDADMPEYAFAIDCYELQSVHVVVQEYQAPRSVELARARDRRREALAVVPQVFGSGSQVHTRLRRTQSPSSQYQPRGTGGQRHVLEEGGLKFLVNFDDFLDTGLFLEQRITRALVREWSNGAHVLNLFCYTGSATVYAAAGGALTTVSVDASNTYLEWARANLTLNGFDRERHELLRADCLDWMQAVTGKMTFDLIYLDSPTFSNSSRVAHVLDIQRDHVGMIRRSMALLKNGGRLLFATHAARFKLEREALSDLAIEDVSRRTLAKDFERSASSTHRYVIQNRVAAADV